ncbi:MAG: hypothetical protein J6V40_05025 [Clostridia bacterium]|nr:hypothetical protein [Clostridia bacterium]
MSKINPIIFDYYNAIRFLRSVQGIIAEIVEVDNALVDFNEDHAVVVLDHSINKYESEIERIGQVYSKVSVVKNDKEIYKNKDNNQLKKDLEYVRDCMIVIAIVKAGMFCSIESALVRLGEN